MRKLKFKGKRVDNGEWVYGNLITHISEEGKGVLHTFIGEIPSYWNTKERGKHFWEHRRWVVIPETVGQFTGLKDKNGIEIYEGDIVSRGTRWPAEEIVWHIGCHTGWAKTDRERSHFYGFGGCDFDPTKRPNGLIIEIIGNTYDNPELLGEQK